MTMASAVSVGIGLFVAVTAVAAFAHEGHIHVAPPKPTPECPAEPDVFAAPPAPPLLMLRVGEAWHPPIAVVSRAQRANR